MPTLTRLTTDYDEAEDRLCLAGEAEDGDIYRLWLTRRLGNRLFATLVERVNTTDRDSAAADLIQSFEQATAQAQLTPTPRVHAGDDNARGWLIVSIDIAQNDDGIGLSFKGDDAGQAAQLILSYMQARQWLSIGHDAYLKAGWPTDIWPDWMRDTKSDDQPAAIH